MRNKTKKNKHKKRNNEKNKTLKQTLKQTNHNQPTSTPFLHKIKGFFRSQRNNKGSYSPTINRNLETLQSIPRQELSDCNIVDAYKLKEPLKIGIPGVFYGESCFNYNTPEAKSFLL